MASPEFEFMKLGNMSRSLLTDIAHEYAAGGGKSVSINQTSAMYVALKLYECDFYSEDGNHKDAFNTTLADLCRGLANISIPVVPKPKPDKGLQH